MKSKKSHISLRQLFRKNLEFAEVSPDAALKAKLMSRVARREFLQFIPNRFNIFYLGAVAGAIIVTASILLYSEYAVNYQTSEDSVKLFDTATYLDVSVAQPISLKNNEAVFSTGERISVEVLPQHVDTGNLIIPEPRKDVTLAPGSIDRSISGSGIFDRTKSEGKKLKGRPEAEGLVIFSMPSSGCAPLKVQLQNISELYDSCVWTMGDGGFSDKKNPEWIYDVEGEYRVSLQVFKGDKILYASANVTVYPRPKAHFEISPEKSNPSDDEVRFLNYSTNAQRFIWDFGDGSASDFFEPTHVYSGSGNFNVRLIAYSERGCTDSLIVYNALAGSEYFIDFPNAFIPNEHGPSGGYYSSKSDEAAQVFHPSFSGVTEYQLKIFSKLGIPVFESNDINLGWDGYNKDQLCEAGVYIWKVRGKFRNGEPFIEMGDVTILKNQ